MVHTFTRKRIEILLDGPHATIVIQAVHDAGIDGYTLIPVQSGAGRGGAWREDRVSGAQTKVILITIASADKADRLIDLLVPILDSHGMLLTMADVQVVRGERF
ncbi:MAG: P-II family nitrogen regulator [Allosphingosinicella sp.]|uniref:P-II family nitrogen regulator n=1 Tax=Allosphingosinicella sp. TaxID=2823234 RepID=UPI003946FDC3